MVGQPYDTDTRGNPQGKAMECRSVDVSVYVSAFPLREITYNLWKGQRMKDNPTSQMRMTLLKYAKIHDIVSDIIEDGKITVGEGPDAVSCKQYRRLVNLLSSTNINEVLKRTKSR